MENSRISRNSLVVFGYKNCSIDNGSFVLRVAREKSFNLYSYRGSIIFKHLILIIARVFSQQIIE